jgi:hypothetical protein
MFRSPLEAEYLYFSTCVYVNGDVNAALINGMYSISPNIRRHPVLPKRKSGRHVLFTMSRISEGFKPPPQMKQNYTVKK